MAKIAPTACPSLPRLAICLASSMDLVKTSNSIPTSCAKLAKRFALSIVVSTENTPSIGSANTTSILSPRDILLSPMA